MFSKLVLLLLLLALVFHDVAGLDVNWVAAEKDGPLPLSSRYRSALQNLCDRMNSGLKVSAEVIAKQAALKAMCLKLNPHGHLRTRHTE